jgi:simple sugar transport system ATP-binding protein
MRVELRDIHKHFGPVRANDGVSLAAEAGTIHGLLGQNGAGKSTLMRTLSGYQSADRGEVVLDGAIVRLKSPADAIAQGVGMLHQDPMDFVALNVLDNFLLGGATALVPDRAEARGQLLTLAAQLGFRLNPDAPLGALTVGERQQLEILRLLWLGAQVLILDEPTTAISAPQRLALFAALRRLAAQGKTVLFVSHKLEEVQDLCDEVTVLARGRAVGTVALPCDNETLVRLMFGQLLARSARGHHEVGAPALELDRLSLSDGRLTVTDLSLTLRAGQVVGLAGLEGSGQRLLLRACAGLARPLAGRLTLGGRDLTGRAYRDFLAAGVAYVPAERLEEGLVSGLSLTEHVALAERRPGLLVDWRATAESAARRIAHFRIKGEPATQVQALSGGNQQRALLALLPEQIKLLLMEHPTRGLDLESTEHIWKLLLERREHGTVIVFASSDLDELVERSDHILVFFSGRVSPPLDARAVTVQELGRRIGGLDG